MLKRRTGRMILGTLLGGAAGLSLTATILPTVLASLGLYGDDFYVRYVLAGYAAHCVLAWGVAGWLAGRLGRGLYGALLLGTVGAISGAALALAALDSGSSVLLGSIFGAACYGAVAGLLIGQMLPEANVPDTADCLSRQL